MTNGEKFKEIFSIKQVDDCDLNVYAWLPNHDAIEIPLEWWNAEYKEPVIRDNGVKNELNRVKDELDPATKNLGVDREQLKTMIRGLTKWYVKRDNTAVGEPDTAVGLLYDDVMFGIDRLPSVTPQLSSELDKNSKKLEKDFGELDCISRKQAIEWVDNLRKMDECFGNHKGDYYPLSEVIDRLQNVPSVTPQEPRWIPVSERLPEECTAVLIWCPDRKNIYCAYLEEKQWWIFGAHFQKVTLEVIAWMPLPKPYSEVEV